MTRIDDRLRPPARTTSESPGGPGNAPVDGGARVVTPGSSRAVATVEDVLTSEVEAAARRGASALVGVSGTTTASTGASAGGGVLGFLAANRSGVAAGHGHDVSAVSDAQLATLRASRDPKQQRLANTIANARRAYADTIAAGGRVVVSASEANGGQPVVTLVPPGFDPDKPVRVHTHYHGYSSTAADAPGHGTRRTENMQAIQARDPQTLFVLPECSNAPTRGAGQGYRADWSNVRDQARTTDDALRAAGVQPEQATEHVVSAHSAGGKALHFAMQHHPDGSGLRADRLQLFDCFYGNWDQAVRDWARTANGARAHRVEYVHGTNDDPRGLSGGLQRAFGDRYRFVSVGNHDRSVARHLDVALPD